MIKRNATAVWSGGLKDGGGKVSTQSGVLDNVSYGFATRFEQQPGTNPEELIAAAHAACYTMAVTAELGHARIQPDKLMTTAVVTLDKAGAGFVISAVHLDLTATIPGGNWAMFDAAARKAKLDCPVSKLLNASVTLETRLES